MSLRFASFAILGLSLSSAQSRAMEMIKVPSGELIAFWLSQAPAGKNTKQDFTSPVIKVNALSVMKYPVTWKEYETFMNLNPSWKKQAASKLYTDETYLESATVQQLSPRSPVTGVSWFAARAFCKSFDMRLPTTDEWEYLAAASETERDANSNAGFLDRILQWYGEPREKQLKNVGSVYKNYYGLWDMHGLVWEWVEDFNSSFVTGESREDSSFNKNMFCGGGVLTKANRENYAAFMRFAFRSSLKGQSSVWNLGFRCVR